MCQRSIGVPKFDVNDEKCLLIQRRKGKIRVKGKSLDEDQRPPG